MIIPKADECQEEMIDHLAEWIESKGLRSPAILFLEASKPLALIGSQALFLLQPLLGLVGPLWGRFDDRALTEYALLLEDPASIDRLLARLEHSNPASAGEMTDQVDMEHRATLGCLDVE